MNAVEIESLGTGFDREDGEAPKAAASTDMFTQLGLITRQLHDTLTELGVMPHLQHAAAGLPDARSRLGYIATKTGEAAEKVLNLVDRAQADRAAIAGATRRAARCRHRRRSRRERRCRRACRRTGCRSRSCRCRDQCGGQSYRRRI